jgi:amino-acid N-acetyltransferase
LTRAGIAADVAHFFLARGRDPLLPVAGAVGLEFYGEYALLRSLAVAREYRGRGLGRRLVARALEAAAGRGAREVYLLTVTAQSFFERLGFTAAAREDVPAPLRQSLEFREVCPASAAVMKKNLTEKLSARSVRSAGATANER